MKKILYITCNDINDNTNGGSKCSKRNYEVLGEFFKVDMMYIKRISGFKSVLSLIEGYFPPFNNVYYHKIIEKVKTKDFACIFMEGSYFGEALKKIRREIDIPFIVFYQNCEIDYINVRFNKGNSIRKFLYTLSIKHNEELSTQTADVTIALSERDASRINELYNRKVDLIAPMSIIDIYEQRMAKQEYCLLLGPSGAANDEGFDWFIKNISPNIKCKTVVIGKNQERHKNTWESDKVIVLGYVDNLSQAYADAKVVAIPLLSGAGMKIKTTEAMMFGKYIVGTSEAFSGYDNKIFINSKLCNTSDEFICAINDYLDNGLGNYIQEQRDLFLKNYSIESTRNLYKLLFANEKLI